MPIVRSNCLTKDRFDGPLVMRVISYMPRGKTVKRKFHTVKPDTTNLVKAVEDCLTKAEVIKDDCQIIHQVNSKVYATDGKVGTYIELFSPEEEVFQVVLDHKFLS